jgi:hypothetical protein
MPVRRRPAGVGGVVGWGGGGGGGSAPWASRGVGGWRVAPARASPGLKNLPSQSPQITDTQRKTGSVAVRVCASYASAVCFCVCCGRCALVCICLCVRCCRAYRAVLGGGVALPPLSRFSPSATAPAPLLCSGFQWRIWQNGQWLSASQSFCEPVKCTLYAL